ncbi:killer toxin resistant protein [Microbotryomycetes sp. JL201]|nr:killer toxin resistant protein [Microbotryomycetes sp. JL201]
MRVALAVAAVCAVAPAVGASSLHVRVETTASTGSLTNRFLHGLALYKPDVAHEFIYQLTSAADELHLESKNPLNRALRPNESYALLQERLQQSGLLPEPRIDMEMLRLTLASRLPDEDLEIYDAVNDLPLSGSDGAANCLSYIAVGIDTHACTVDEFWSLVGEEQRTGTAPIIPPVERRAILDAPFDILYPRQKDKNLPFFSLFGSSTDPAFGALYNLLHDLAEQNKTPSRVQFSVRWISDPKVPTYPMSIAFAESTLHLDPDSVPQVPVADLPQLSLRAAAHILASSDPLTTMVDVTQNLPIIAPRLAELHPVPPARIERAMKVTSLPTTFAINGNFIHSVTPGGLIRELLAERKILADLVGLSKRLGYTNALDIVMAPNQKASESIKGRGNNNVVKPTPENPLKVVNLVDALKDVPSLFTEHSFIEASVAGEDPVSSVTIFLVTDLNTKAGREYVDEALNFIDPYNNVRISLVHNPLELARTVHPFELSDLVCLLTVARTFSSTKPSDIREWLRLDVGPEGPDFPERHSFTKDNPLTAFVKRGASPEQQEFGVTWWTILRGFLKHAGLHPGSSGMIINGRVVNFLKRPFPKSNFRMTVEHERAQRIDAIANAVLETSEWDTFDDRRELANVINLACSIITAQSLPVGKMPRTRASREIPEEYPRFTAGASPSDALFEVAIVVNPTQREARQWMPIINGLAQTSFVRVEVYLAPSLVQKSKVPTTIYSRGFPTTLRFDQEGSDVAPTIDFINLPGEAVVKDVAPKLHAPGTFELIEGINVTGRALRDLPEEAMAVYRYTWIDPDEILEPEVESDENEEGEQDEVAGGNGAYEEEDETTPMVQSSFHFGMHDEL